ncbi:hypothetical protein [Picosynechococcus sp. PCC 7117]|uniref:hypothetical protein n=1 Tax=Picosynechococcus sp. PCC 7117 TaxID=195498 RepID=UPI0008106955|nr:hypothetical protein [Picosynechococcus sp. PCC 7117]ANV87363.1 hypothetical protein AWQ22_07785 [Picosynechococcus sp. PCC 7117]
MHSLKYLVYPKLPRAGLGNMLFVWANALVFAEINQLPIVAPNWGMNSIHLGSYLRNEKYKRFYGSYFSNQEYVSRSILLLQRMKGAKIYFNPDILSRFSSQPNTKKSHIFVFDKILRYQNCFADIKSHQELIKEKLISNIKEELLKEIFTREIPRIGIHVRLSDFQKQKIDINNLEPIPGLTRTPVHWFADVLNIIRDIAGYSIPAIIFSDGSQQELQPLLKLDRVLLAPKASAIEDLIILSKSQLLIASSGSTFSSWASFLGQCPTIWYPARNLPANTILEESKLAIFEGAYNPKVMEVPELLACNVSTIFN